ncbi:MAG: site-specific integrase [Clostridia bacterium]|nr:site-specific integrase [Clostridia bacterium]
MKYGTYLKQWIKTYKEPFIKSADSIRRNVRLHVPESLKNKELAKLNGLEVQQAINNIKMSRTRVIMYDIYHGSLKLAYKLGLIERNVADLLIKPKHKRKNGSALTKQELNDFIGVIQNEKLYYYFMFIIYTGCRRSEALGVKWSDIDFTKKVIHIKGTKTEKSDRHVPLFPELESILKQKERKGVYLFPFSKGYVSKTFSKLCPGHKLHDLRHTFATRCLECDINIKIVQRWLGHSRLDTTASIYTHVQEDFVKSESEKFKIT